MDKLKKQEETLQMISLYREREVLWNANSFSYRRKDLKKKALEEIGREFNMTEVGVKKKLKSLRSTYVMEKKKVEESKTSGCDPSDVYEPSLFWYGEMRFLDNSISRRKSKDIVRLDNKTTLKPQEVSIFTIMDRQQPQIYKKPTVCPVDQQIYSLAPTSRKTPEIYEIKVQSTTTIDDDLYRDPISVNMSPNRDIKPEILDEYEESQLSPNHSICMGSDSNTVGDSVKQVEDDDKVSTDDRSNSPLATRTHPQDYANWEEDMRRKKLCLELEQLELTNYKIKLELYEMEQKLKLNPSKFTHGIRCQKFPN